MALAALARGPESVVPPTALSYAPEHPLLQQIRGQVPTLKLPYAGDVTPALGTGGAARGGAGRRAHGRGAHE